MDYQLEDTLYLPFTTRQFSDGVPTTLAGSPVVTAYRDANLTQFTTGITLSVDFDGIAGLNMITVVATAANNYVAGETYTLYLSAGTVGGVSVVGEVVAHFTLDMSAAAKDLANGTDGLGAIKADTAAILTDTGTTIPGTIATAQADLDIKTGATGVNLLAATQASIDAIEADTSELQSDDVPGLIAALDAVVDTVKGDTAAILVDTGTSGVALLAATQASIDAIEADTSELQSDDVPGLIAALDAVVDTVKAETALIVADTSELQTDDYPTSIAALQTDLDTLTDARGEPAQGAPAVSTTMLEKIDYLYKAWRNKSTQTATTYSLFADDATTVDHKATVSDDATTATKGEVGTGP